MIRGRRLSGAECAKQTQSAAGWPAREQGGGRAKQSQSAAIQARAMAMMTVSGSIREAPSPAARRCIRMALPGSWYDVTRKPADAT